MKHYKSVEILSIFRVSSPLAQTLSPPHKRKAPLLKTFWWRFWLDAQQNRPSRAFAIGGKIYITI